MTIGRPTKQVLAERLAIATESVKPIRQRVMSPIINKTELNRRVRNAGAQISDGAIDVLCEIVESSLAETLIRVRVKRRGGGGRVFAEDVLQWLEKLANRST